MIKVLITGNGSGKTTSAIGKAIRFIGNEQSVYFRSFFKTPTSESSILMGIQQCYPKLLDYQTCGVLGFDKREQFHAGVDELRKCPEMEQKYDVIILDEITYMFKELNWDRDYILLYLLNLNCDYLIITGRDCPRWFIKLFNTVSEVKKIKHIYDKTKQVMKGLDY
jgi:cob(I)alamin adenosyltransferase